jgi:hypothetical protein
VLSYLRLLTTQWLLAWEALLPQLLGILDANHKERLEREKRERKYDRESKITKWLHLTKTQLKSLAKAVPKVENESESSASVAEVPTYQDPYTVFLLV